MSPSNLAASSAAPNTNLPVLNVVLPESDNSEALRAALSALEQEKMAFMAASGALLEALRPEMERMAAELVRNSLHHAWRLRFQTGGRVVGSDIP